MTDQPARRMVMCVKLGRELPGLDAPPWPGPLGKRIFDHVSLEAWEMWEERMKMILNEYRLLPFQKEAQQIGGQADGRVLLRRGTAHAGGIHDAREALTRFNAHVGRGFSPAERAGPEGPAYISHAL